MIDLKSHGWHEVKPGRWLYPCDTGFSHQREHSTDEAEHRTTKALMTNKRIVDVWVLAPRSTEDGIAMGIIHPPREFSVVDGPNAESSHGGKEYES